MVLEALTVFYNPESGEMTALNQTKRFKAETELLRADVLKDLLDRIMGAYDEAVTGMEQHAEMLRMEIAKAEAASKELEQA